MNSFTYNYPVKVYFGEKAADKNLKAELAKVGPNVLFVYGGGSIRKNGVYDELMAILQDAGKNVTEFTGIMSNPTYWVVVMLVSLSNMALGKVLGDANRDDPDFYHSVRATFKPLWIDMGIKTFSFILAMAVYPPIVMFGVILAGLIPSITFCKIHGTAADAK